MQGMVIEDKDECVRRSQQAEQIIAEYEREHGWTLPVPWHGTIQMLLLRGLNDAMLQRIFDTLMQVEHEAGRLAEPPSPIYRED